VAQDSERFQDLVDWLMFGVFLGNGQACSATSRLLLHTSVAPLLLPRLIAAVEGVQVGDNSAYLRLSCFSCFPQLQLLFLIFVDRCVAAVVQWTRKQDWGLL